MVHKLSPGGLGSLAAAAISEEEDDDEVVFVKTIEANEAKPRPYAVAVEEASLAQKLRGVFSASSHGQYSSMYEPPLSPLPSRATAAADFEIGNKTLIDHYESRRKNKQTVPAQLYVISSDGTKELTQEGRLILNHLRRTDHRDGHKKKDLRHLVRRHEVQRADTGGTFGS
jgi:hypothetical protein